MRNRFLAGVAALTLVATACDEASDSLLEAIDPDIINPVDIANAEGARALAAGALRRFTLITAGGESTWLFGGLLVDEWGTSSTFIQNDETDQRRVSEQNSLVTGMMRDLGRARTTANQAIAAINKYLPNERPTIAELYFARGFAELQLASDFCNGIVISNLDAEGEIIPGERRTVREVLDIAIASFDSARTFANGTDSRSVLVERAARIGKARALQAIGRDRLAEAAALVPASNIPTTYAYQHTFTVNTGRNQLWSFGISNQRYSVADSVEGNGRNLLVRNALPFFSAQDPRLPVTDTRRAGQDGQTFVRTTTLYGEFTPVDVVNGIDARLIEAEAALQAGNTTAFLGFLNGLRATSLTLGTVAYAANRLPALTDPGTVDGRINLLFREKAFWTFSRGQRLGDLRRLVRQYNRAPTSVFPEGTHYKGSTYGGDTNFPLVQAERPNPHVPDTGGTDACLNRNP